MNLSQKCSYPTFNKKISSNPYESISYSSSKLHFLFKYLFSYWLHIRWCVGCRHRKKYNVRQEMLAERVYPTRRDNPIQVTDTIVGGR